MLELEHTPPIRRCVLDCAPRNVLGRGAIEALARALAEDEAAPAVVLAGREDAFCAGLDGRVLAGGGAEAEALLADMGRLLADLLANGTRLVSACRGHAVAAGAMLLLVSDWRVGAYGNYRIGFTEPRLGLPLPELPALLARERLDRRRLHALTVLGRTLSPEEALEAGFLDELVPPERLDAVAAERARDLASLTSEAYAATTRAVHGPLIERADALARAQAERARRAALD